MESSFNSIKKSDNEYKSFVQENKYMWLIKII